MRPRILSAQFSHESNSFSTVATDMDSFRGRILVEGPKVAERFAGTLTELGAHLESAARYEWDLVQPFAAHATPAGPVTTATFEYFTGQLTAACRKGVDGILLALHGAMVCESEDDVEGHLLERLRGIVGPKVPIAVTLDMHANVTERMAANANVLIAYRTYPHIDQHTVATEAAALVQRSLEGAPLPRTFLFRLPLLDGCDHGRTHGDGPMPQLLQLADELRAADARIDAISICAGFPWSDIPEAGPSVTVTTSAGNDVAERAARRLLAEMWRLRAETTVELLSLDEIAAVAKGYDAKNGPLVIADFTDNPGHGAPGDGVALVRALLEAGVRKAAVACICDPEVATQCHAAGVGAQVDIQLGAKRYPELYGPPLACRATVKSVSDGRMVYEGPMRKGTVVSLGPTAMVQVDGVSIIVSTNNLQTQDRQFFYTQGIDPLACDILVVKSQQHFRAAFAPIASRVVLADSGGFVSSDFSRLPYRKVRRPIWPLDEHVRAPAWLGETQSAP